MGYLTKVKIDVKAPIDKKGRCITCKQETDFDSKKVFDYIDKKHSYWFEEGCFSDGVKFHDSPSFFADLAEVFRDIELNIECIGEEEGDHTLTRIKKGVVQTVRAVTTFPEFE